MTAGMLLLAADPDAGLAAELSRFEEEFSYPLGDGTRFRIEHGGDGWRFFHALGEAVYAVARADGGVQGVAGAALRRVIAPDGSAVAMVYLGDLKIAATARGGMVLLRLARALQTRFEARARAGFAVVMDGTALTPSMYTGRLGIPAFAPVAAVAILWLATGGAAPPPAQAGSDDGIRAVAEAIGCAVFAGLAAGCYRMPDGKPGERSAMAPQWLVSADGHACGRLEDTVRAKRLRLVSGGDMNSAHLSCFAYRTLDAGLRLLKAALSRAAQAGYPLLFVAVAPADAAGFCARVGAQLRSCAGATVFATAAKMPGQWIINTAEI